MNKFFISLVSFFLTLFILGQKYNGDIEQNEPRIRDYKEKKNFPEEMKLFYKSKESDYIVFYDLDGNEALYQYRRNQFDQDADYKISGLKEGQAYRVKGRWKGMLVYYNPIIKKNFFPPEYFSLQELKPELIQDRNNKPVFVLVSFESVGFEQVIY